MRRITPLLLVCSTVVFAQDAPLKPRELFYKPIVPARPEAKPPQVEPPKPPEPKADPKAKPPKPPKQTRAPKSDPVDVPAVQASLDAAQFPLALRYSLERRTAAGTYVAASTEAEFRAGDAIRLKVESNDAGYLYVVQEGSSNTWSLLIPDPQIDGGRNHVPAHKAMTIPKDGAFRFYNDPGVERIFIVFSRKPQPDLQTVIDSLKRGGSQKRSTGGSVQIAQARPELPNELIQKVSLVSRDLVYEKEPADEKAVYVASPDKSAEAEVVAHIALKHQ